MTRFYRPPRPTFLPAQPYIYSLYLHIMSKGVGVFAALVSILCEQEPRGVAFLLGPNRNLCVCGRLEGQCHAAIKTRLLRSRPLPQLDCCFHLTF